MCRYLRAVGSGSAGSRLRKAKAELLLGPGITVSEGKATTTITTGNSSEDRGGDEKEV